MASDGRRIVGFFPGTWDLLHPGHIRALKEAKEHCDELIVGVNASPTGKEPIMSHSERREMIEALEVVDKVFPYFNDGSLYKWDRIKRWDIRFMGADHQEIHHPIKAKVIKISRDHDYSSTAIRERCVA